ncbi:MAG: hypothetical protein ENTB_05038 [Enterocloster aldenensis]
MFSNNSPTLDISPRIVLSCYQTVPPSMAYIDRSSCYCLICLYILSLL